MEESGGRDWRNDKMKAKGIPGEILGEGSYKRGQSSTPLNDVKQKITVGWKQSCECSPHDPVPCRVLDPFSGSATTGMVANRLGRNYVGTDLNIEYLDLARRRILELPPPSDNDQPSSTTVLDLF